MKRAAFCLACLIAILPACDRGPSAEELEAQRRAAEALATPTPKPTPKPGDWMYDKKRNNPLDQPAKR